MSVAILALNAAVFVAMAAGTGGKSLWNPGIETLLEWGADFGPRTLDGQYWRALTNTFVHIGIIHLAMNMYVFWDVGRLVERLFGSGKFLALYLTAGLGGSLASLYWNPMIVSAGASGAVFGTFGGLLAFFLLHRAHFEPEFLKKASKSVLLLLLYNLVFGLSVPGIDNAGHVGGVAAGFLAGLCLAPAKPGERAWSSRNRVLQGLLLAVFMGIGLAERQHVQNRPEVIAEAKGRAYNRYIGTLRPLLEEQDRLVQEINAQAAHGFTPDALGAFPASALARALQQGEAFQAAALEDSELAEMHAFILSRAAGFVTVLQALQAYAGTGDTAHLERFTLEMKNLGKALDEFVAARDRFGQKYGMKFNK